MPAAKKPKNELQRIKELESFDILDTEPEEDYDEIVELASYICKTPISLISLVDNDRQWFKAKKGVEAQQTSRDLAFCSYAILSPDEPLIVEDATKDKRFDDNNLVLKNPKIRFYAGIPLKTKSGHALGTLCVIDGKSNKISQEQVRALEILSKSVVNLLELRRDRDKEREGSNNKSKDDNLKLTKENPFRGGVACFKDTSVLIAEDNRTNMEIAKQMFSNLGCNVRAVVNGEESISVVKDEKFDIIFMDCHMPKMDGYEASREIKKMMKGNKIAVCPIIAFTANSGESDKDKCTSAGMDDFLSKPVQMGDIKEMLSKWLV